MFQHVEFSSSISLPLENEILLSPIHPDDDESRRRSSSLPRVRSSRSFRFLTQQRRRGGFFEHEKPNAYPSPPPSPPPSPFRSVSRMKEPFQLMLPDGYSTSDMSASRHPRRIRSLPPPPPEEGSEVPLPRMDAIWMARRQIQTPTHLIRNLSVETTSKTSNPLALGSLPPSTTSITEELHCSCLPPGSPCEKTCILSDYEDNPKNARIHVEETILDRIPGSESSGLGTPIEMSPCDELPPNLTEQTSRSNLGMSGHEGIETEAGWLAGDLNSTSWLEDASADEESEGSSILAASSVQGNLAERCWLSDEPEDIDKSLEQAVAVSPTRPCLVEIPRRSTSLPRKDSMEVSQNSGTSGQVTPQRSLRRVKCYTTLTPPKTPTYARALDYDDDKTPTQQSLQAKDQHMLSRIQKTASIISQITADNIGHPLLTLDQEQGDILSHLQFSIAQFPSTMLQIDSPVILALRKPPIPSYPHPHPHDKRRSVRFNMPDPSTHRSSIYTAVPSPPHSRPNSASNDPSRLAPLRIIFPETSNFLRETLYAHFIALNYLENLFTPLLPAFDIPQHTPPKAMAMLGIIPATNCVDDDKVNSEEIRDVKVGLRLCIGRLMEAICGRGRGVGDELLMVSVGQVVKLIETGRYKEDLP